MLDYISWVLVRINDKPCGSSYLIINNFSQVCCGSAIWNKRFQGFSKVHFDLMWGQKHFLEISCYFVGEVHLSFSLTVLTGKDLCLTQFSTEVAAELAASELFHTFTRSVKFYTFYYQFRCLKSQQKEHRFFWKTVLGILKIALRLRDRRVFMLRSLKILNILAL